MFVLYEDAAPSFLSVTVSNTDALTLQSDSYVLNMSESAMTVMTAIEQGPRGPAGEPGPEGPQGPSGYEPVLPDLALLFEGALI